MSSRADRLPLRVLRPAAGLVAAAVLALPGAAGAAAGPGSTSSTSSTGPTGPAGGPVAADVLAPDAPLELSVLGRYSTGELDESAAEIVAHDPVSQRLFVVDALDGRVDVLDVSAPATPTRLLSISFRDGEVPNSVAVRGDGLVAVAVEAPRKTDPGRLVLLDGRTDGVPAQLASVQVGALPDMVTWTPDGRKALVANEGEPAAPGDDGFEDAPEQPGYAADPAGSVSVVTVAAPGPGRDRPRVRVRTAGFERFDARADELVAQGLRLTGPTAASRRLSTNVEPEYIAVDDDSRTAYVTLQEADAVAEVDLVRDRVVGITPLADVDHSVAGHGIDPSDRDGVADVRPVPVTGQPMPDSIAAYAAGDGTYLVTADEGDSRAYGDEDTWRTTGGFYDEARVKDLGEGGLPPLCPTSPAAGRTDDADLGRLTVSWPDGLSADGSCVQDLHSYGTRSFSIWSTDGERVFDSAEDFEDITAAALPEFFNSDNDENTFDTRSDAKGPEPEGVAVGTVGDATYAFIGLERVGGIMVYDITDPRDARFVQYLDPRDFSVALEDEDGDVAADWQDVGDLGPEGLAFIAAADSPVPGTAVLAVGNEVSGTTTLFRVDPRG